MMENKEIAGEQKNICVILARQRSGTTVVRSLLNSHPEIAALGEVFHPETSSKFLLGFYNFWYSIIQNDRRLLNTEICKADAVDQYFEAIRGVIDFKKIITLDIKYSQAQNAPKLFEYMNYKKLPVIHIKRKNVLATYISNIVTNSRMNAKSPTHGYIQLRDEKVIVPCKNIIEELSQREYEHTYYMNMIGNCPVIELIYEDLFFTEGDYTYFKDEYLEKISNFLSIDKYRMRTNLIKQGHSNLRLSVDNWDELVLSLSNTRFANMIN